MHKCIFDTRSFRDSISACLKMNLLSKYGWRFFCICIHDSYDCHCHTHVHCGSFTLLQLDCLDVFWKGKILVYSCIFTALSVSHSVHRGGVCLSAWWDTPPGSRHPPVADTPRGRHPPRSRHTLRSRHPPSQCMLRDKGNKRAVRILLECILVVNLIISISRAED